MIAIAGAEIGELSWCAGAKPSGQPRRTEDDPAEGGDPHWDLWWVSPTGSWKTRIRRPHRDRDLRLPGFCKRPGIPPEIAPVDPRGISPADEPSLPPAGEGINHHCKMCRVSGRGKPWANPAALRGKTAGASRARSVAASPSAVSRGTGCLTAQSAVACSGTLRACSVAKATRS